MKHSATWLTLKCQEWPDLSITYHGAKNQKILSSKNYNKFGESENEQ